MYNSEKREKILTCAENLFRKYGTRSISMDDMAHHLSMSKKTIYESFADKVSYFILENIIKIEEKGTEAQKAENWEILENVIRLGHQVEEFPTFNFSVPSTPNINPETWTRTFDKIIRTYSEGYDSKLFAKLARHVEDYNPDLIICTYRFINPSLVKLLKKPTRKIVHVNPDQMVTLGYQQVFASDYDAWFVKDPYMLKFMVSNMKLNTFLYQEAFNKREHIKPNISKVECENEIGIDVITYGTVYPYRERMLKAVVDSGIDLKIYGVIPNRFYNHTLDKQFQNRYITGEEKSKILYGSDGLSSFGSIPTKTKRRKLGTKTRFDKIIKTIFK